MASDTYWQRRQAEADAAMERDERSVAKRVARAYETEMAALDREIASYYQRWGVDGVLSYRTMLETMDPSDRDLLMRDCDAFAKAYPDLAGMVEIRKGIYKLDRLEGLQASARCHLAQATAEATDGLADHFARQAARSANAVADTMGLGRNFHSMDDDAMRRFVGTKWAGGQDYSERIWGSADKLADYVTDDMAKAFVRGDSYERISKALGHRFVDVSESSVSRLVYTEGTYVARQAQASEFRREGFDTYTISTVGDERTCSECSGVASASESEPFRFEDESVGTNFPPLHPRCRCQVNPAVSDWDAWCKGQMDQERARKAAGRFVGGGVNGALDDASDPDMKKMIAHAESYYDEVRGRNRSIEVTSIARNSGVDKKTVDAAYQHIFINEYNLGGERKRFDPSYEMAQSWQRLRDGKDIQHHDITLLYHEEKEGELMDSGMSYDMAHMIVCKKYGYDYPSELHDWTANKKRK